MATPRPAPEPSKLHALHRREIDLWGLYRCSKAHTLRGSGGLPASSHNADVAEVKIVLSLSHLFVTPEFD